MPDRIYIPITAMGFSACLPFSWTTLRGKQCRHPYGCSYAGWLGQNLTCDCLLISVFLPKFTWADHKIKFWLNWIKYGAVSYSLSCIRVYFLSPKEICKTYLWPFLSSTRKSCMYVCNCKNSITYHTHCTALHAYLMYVAFLLWFQCYVVRYTNLKTCIKFLMSSFWHQQNITSSFCVGKKPLITTCWINDVWISLELVSIF
jgi:hypothetical protein